MQNVNSEQHVQALGGAGLGSMMTTSPTRTIYVRTAKEPDGYIVNVSRRPYRAEYTYLYTTERRTRMLEAIGNGIFKAYYHCFLRYLPGFARGWRPFRKHFWQPHELAALATLDPEAVYIIEQKTGLYWQGTNTIQ